MPFVSDTQGLPSASSRRRIAHGILLLILIAAASLRLWHLTASSFWLDEFFTAEVAAGRGYWFQDVPRDRVVYDAEPGNVAVPTHTTPLSGSVSDVIDSLVRTNHPPLYFVTLHGWMALLGSSDRSLRGFSVLCSVLAIAFLFDAIRSLSGTRAAIAGSVTMALAGPQIQYAQEARAYSMLVAIMLATCAIIARIERRGINERRLIALFISMAALLLTHYLGAALFAAIAIYGLLRLRGAARTQSAAAMLLALCVASALWGPFLWEQRTEFANRIAWMRNIPGPETWLELIVVALRLPVQSFSLPTIFGTNSANTEITLGASLFCLPLLLRKRRSDLLLWWMILVASIGVVAIGDAWRGTNAMLFIRYTLPATAAVYALLAALISMIPFIGRLAMFTPALLCLHTLQLATPPDKPDWRPIAQFMSTHCDSHNAAVIYGAENLDWSQDALLLGIRHYAPQWNAPVVLLDRPATPQLLATLPGRGLWLINPSSDSDETLMPGYTAHEKPYRSPLAICSYLTPVQTTSIEGVRLAALR